MVNIAISLLGVKQDKRVQMVNNLQDKGVKWVHYDVMDEQFVSQKAISLNMIQDIVTHAKRHIVDVHLMVKNPYLWIQKIEHIVDYVSFHFEATSKKELEIILKTYRGKINLGLAINPETKFEQFKDLIKDFHYILIMSVKPGLGGQKFQKAALKKIKLVKKEIKKLNQPIIIGVDGGIDNHSGPLAIKAGANILISGSYLATNPTKARIEALKTISS